MPTKEQMQKVIDTLTKVLPQAKGNFDIMNGNICGTVHCVGGWYFLAKYPEMNEESKKYFNYENGANLMAQDLGFKDSFELKQWTKNNPKKWGNKYGVYMFASTLAYNDAKSINGIIKFLKQVKSRL